MTWRYIQLFVLKHFDQPMDEGGHRWVLAHIRRSPNQDEWHTPFRVPSPFLSREEIASLTHAHVHGCDVFNEPPSDKQVETFLRETNWTPDLGMREASVLGGIRTITTKLTGGGIDRALWKSLFGRDVPTTLFPELKKIADDQK